MSTHNNLRPRHLPTWLGITLLCVLAVAATVIEVRLQPRGFAVAAYIVTLFVVILFSFRVAWQRRMFWVGFGVLLGLHALAGFLLLLLIPNWLEMLQPFLTVVVLFDLLLTMSVLWRVTVGQKPMRR